MTTPDYPPDAWLPLSGIQHFVFCRRQWALIHVERAWQENARFARSVPVSSAALGLSGVCDVVEFRRLGETELGGVALPGRAGRWQPTPVEYKRGRAKRDPCDEAQLCAQAMCLEEMLACSIPRGCLYYGETRHRQQVEFGADLRDLVGKAAREMRSYFERTYTPRVKPFKACKACSLADVCLPELLERSASVARYMKSALADAE
ncbi:MAG: CRISPR-associated protein Cas4 [Polyangiaceae bacterium]|nr:CRISPR-associated protein Cas4 [Polyangiaceae bacterium]